MSFASTTRFRSSRFCPTLCAPRVTNCRLPSTAQKLALGDPRYDLIIADARMPNLDGWRLIMEARAGGFMGKVIVFSALMDDHERQRYRYLEIDRFLEKPRNQASSCGL